MSKKVKPEEKTEPKSPATGLEWLSQHFQGESLSEEYVRLLLSHEQLHEKNAQAALALASATHDMKIPLSVITGYTDLLLSGKCGPLNEKQGEILSELKENCVRLQKYLQDFLASTAIETGDLSMRFETADLNSCLREIYDFWIPEFKKSGVALFYPHHDTIPEFPFDWHKVQRIVSNLLDNAMKFTPSGGSTWLTAQLREWDGASRGEQSEPRATATWDTDSANAVQITVADTGPGVPPEDQQTIFQDFVRLGSDNKAKGMGLGLAIARRMVRAHGGTIWVESEAEIGSKFSFYLPLQPPETANDLGGNQIRESS